MGLRILTGILIPRRSSGNATIHFHPHQVTGDADGSELTQLGDEGDFDKPPGKIVSLRHFILKDREIAPSDRKIDIEQIQLEDHSPSTHRMVIRWWVSCGTEIKEISYMIIGSA